MIIINARFLTQQTTGVQRFAIEISKKLNELRQDVVFVSPKNVIHQELCEQLQVEKIGPFTGHLWEQITLPAYVVKKRALLISFCNTAPWIIYNQIITIHDLCFYHYPEWYTKTFSTFYNFLIPRIARRAKHVLTVSETSKKDINKTFQISNSKISVVYNAVAPIFLVSNDSDTNHNETFERYILTVSSHHPRKNFDFLLRVFDRLDIKDLKLFIIGGFDRNFITNKNYYKGSNKVKMLKDISDQELVQYYRNAELFVYPSLFEGFGIPIIEALSQNKEVLISDIPVFREICGPLATYFDPKDEVDFANKIREKLQNEPKETNFDFSKYDWGNGAKQIVNLVRSFHNY